MKFAIALAILLVAVAIVEAGLPPPPCCDDVQCKCCITEDECKCKDGKWCPGTGVYPDCCPKCLDCSGHDLCIGEVIEPPCDQPCGGGSGAGAGASASASADASASAAADAGAGGH